jgi:phosphoglycerol transferase MdoB-like AlkP superfamily enzyme
MFILRLMAFWVLFFAAFRLWFVLWFNARWPQEDPGNIWGSFWHGLPLDLSMMGYLILLPVLLWHIGAVIGKKGHSFISSTINAFNYLIISIMVIICGANVFIYEEWQTPINNRAIQYLSTPRALLDSMSLGFKIASVFIAVGGIWLFWRAYRYCMPDKMYPDFISRWWALGVLPALFVAVVAIRGGFGVMPINESAVYYTSNSFCNHAATNPVWHLIHTQLEVKSTTNHYVALPKEEAKACVDSLFQQRSIPMPEILQIPENTKPNVVFIVMESMTAQVIEALGGKKGVCPNLERLTHEGLSFKNCYGSGYRTDQGVVAVLGGYPSQPDQSIVLLSEKAEKLNSVSRILKEKESYQTLFVYGGELTFANIGVWLRNQKFDKVISEDDFPKAEITQRWGVDDRLMLNITGNQSVERTFFCDRPNLKPSPSF